MGCDTSCITLSWVTEISLPTQRMLAVLLESLELVPAEDVVHCVHLERPVNSEAPKLSKISKLKNRGFFQKASKLEAVLTPAVSTLTVLQLAGCLCKFNI